ncbi:hypothetical protein B0H34DRAFT_678164 [Crassisporium funariophilum]|nr:hypothetical protein B0H34DRAFT_678164 [Crassisporium funariophilum]
MLCASERMGIFIPSKYLHHKFHGSLEKLPRLGKSWGGVVGGGMDRGRPELDLVTKTTQACLLPLRACETARLLNALPSLIDPSSEERNIWTGNEFDDVVLASGPCGRGARANSIRSTISTACPYVDGPSQPWLLPRRAATPRPARRATEPRQPELPE